MDADAQSDWINIYPSALDAVAFSQNQSDVYIDFGKSTFCLYGAATKIGSILVLWRPKITTSSIGRCYFVSLIIPDLTQLSTTFSDVMNMFNFNMAAVEVMAYDGNIRNLTQDLQTAFKNFAAQGLTIPDASTILAPMLPSHGTDPLGQGAVFFATLSTSGFNELTKALTGVANSSHQPSITMYAQIKSVLAQTTFSVSINQLYLLGGAILVTGNGWYSPASGSNEASLTIKASLTLTIGSTSPAFTVAINIAKSSTTITAGTSPKSIQNPFGGMFNVLIVTPTFSGTIVSQVSTYTLSGTVDLGGSPPLKLTSQLLFNNSGTPSVFSITASTINIVSVFAQIIQPKSTSAG